MSETVNRLNARLIRVEKQRDQLAKEALDLAVQLRTLRAENLRYRDKLLELAAGCKSCQGTGCVEDVVEHARFGPQVQTIECESCLDIRTLLE